LDLLFGQIAIKGEPQKAVAIDFTKGKLTFAMFFPIVRRTMQWNIMKDGKNLIPFEEVDERLSFIE
jgi:hypothetical protein